MKIIRHIYNYYAIFSVFFQPEVMVLRFDNGKVCAMIGNRLFAG